MTALRTLLLLGLCLAGTGAVAAPAGEDRWITAFGQAFAPWDERGAIEQLPFHDFSGRTYRYVATLAVPAGKVRVRLSNELEHRDLVIGDATLAIVGVAGSQRHLSWGSGKTRGRAPPGAPLLSDPVDLDVAPGQKLMISLYFPETYIPAGHASARSADGAWSTTVGRREKVNAFFSLKGNFVDDSSAQGAGTEVNPLVAGIEVVPPTSGWKSVVVIGTDPDSRLDGWAARLAARAATRRIAVANLALPVPDAASGGAGESDLSRLDRDLIARPSVDAAILRRGARVAPADQADFAYGQIVRRAQDHDIAILADLSPPADRPRSDANAATPPQIDPVDLGLLEQALAGGQETSEAPGPPRKRSRPRR